MELMREPYTSIMLMPYTFFIDTLTWKIDLEDEKRKKMEEKTKGSRTTSYKMNNPIR